MTAKPGEGRRDVMVTVSWRERERLMLMDKYDGAMVIAPKRGLHRKKTATLDFKSLYPSVDREINACSTTEIPLDQLDARVAAHELSLETDVFVVTNERTNERVAAFVRPHVREGIFPRMERKMMSWRDDLKALKKRLMNQAADPTLSDLERNDATQRADLMDSRQLSAKEVANSLYGVGGAKVSFHPTLETAHSITTVGQNVLMRTAERATSHYTRANNFPSDTEIVYGDTDSVFVKFTNAALSMDAAMHMAERMAAEISDMFKVRVVFSERASERTNASPSPPSPQFTETAPITAVARRFGACVRIDHTTTVACRHPITLQPIRCVYLGRRRAISVCVTACAHHMDCGATAVGARACVFVCMYARTLTRFFFLRTGGIRPWRRFSHHSGVRKDLPHPLVDAKEKVRGRKVGKGP